MRRLRYDEARCAEAGRQRGTVVLQACAMVAGVMRALQRAAQACEVLCSTAPSEICVSARGVFSSVSVLRRRCRLCALALFVRRRHR